MSVVITTNNHPREILDWIPEEAAKEFDYIKWDRVEEGKESVSFVKYRGEYWDLNSIDGKFPHDPEWYYASQSYGFGFLFKLVDVDGDMLIVCGTYIVKG